jgi:sulfofructose kinase
VVTGLVVVDVLVQLPEAVTPNDKHEVRSLNITGGGPAANASATLASLGWKTAHVARIGHDTVGRIARAEMERCGIGRDLLIDDPDARPGVAVVQIHPSTGERTVFYNLTGYRFLRRADIPADAIRAAKLVLVDGYEAEAALAVLESAATHGIPSVLDIEAGEPETLLKLLALAGHAILPIEGARRLTGEHRPAEVLRQLARHTRAQLIVTDGTEGSWALTPGGIHHQPALPVRALDTTGCGDAYHGAYASALLDGLSLPLRMEFASWIAAKVALQFGGRTGLPTRATLAREDPALLSPELRAHVLKQCHEGKSQE